jgi:hypothetical protein
MVGQTPLSLLAAETISEAAGGFAKSSLIATRILIPRSPEFRQIAAPGRMRISRHDDCVLAEDRWARHG